MRERKSFVTFSASLTLKISVSLELSTELENVIILLFESGLEQVENENNLVMFSLVSPTGEAVTIELFRLPST